MKLTKCSTIIAATCLLLMGCNSFDKLLESSDYEAKYNAAMKYYNNNSYSRASQLFENLKLYYHGKEHAEEISWYYAQSLYRSKDYYTAGYQFSRFVSQHPYSQHAEEASFLAAYCKYLDAPDYYLDQTGTKMAIEELEHFVEMYPRSVYMPQVNQYLDEMRAKLTKKDYEVAYEYYNIEEYLAAYESFKRFLNLYPEAEQREEASFYLLEAGYRYAAGSREEKQRERFQQVLNDFEKFSTGFRDSKHMARAQEIYTKSRAALTAIEEQQSK